MYIYIYCPYENLQSKFCTIEGQYCPLSRFTQTFTVLKRRQQVLHISYKRDFSYLSSLVQMTASSPRMAKTPVMESLPYSIRLKREGDWVGKEAILSLSLSLALSRFKLTKAVGHVESRHAYFRVFNSWRTTKRRGFQ